MTRAELDSERAEAALKRVLTSPPTAPIWEDESFWSRRWTPMVDRAGDAQDRVAAESLKARVACAPGRIR